MLLIEPNCRDVCRGNRKIDVFHVLCPEYPDDCHEETFSDLLSPAPFPNNEPENPGIVGVVLLECPYRKPNYIFSSFRDEERMQENDGCLPDEYMSMITSRDPHLVQ
jgi:hypothetical protein